MGLDADWDAAFAGVGPSLLAAAIWTGALLIGAQGLNETRRSYFFGIGAAVAAYLVVLLGMVLTKALIPTTPAWVLYVVVPPLVEEAARNASADTVHRRPTWRHWMSFGIGYALFESGLKLGDAITVAGRSDVPELWIGVIAPIVPFLLHLFLSLLMCSLLHRGVGLLTVYFVSVGLHAAHNWSVMAYLPTNVPDLLVMISVRSAVFFVLITIIILLARRSQTASVEAPG